MGICCIDEFNLIKNKDYNAILESMEQGTYSASKAGLTTTVNTRATVIG